MSLYHFERPHLTSSIKSDYQSGLIHLRSLKTEVALKITAQGDKALIDVEGLDDDLVFAALETLFLASDFQVVRLSNFATQRFDLRALRDGSDYEISKALFALIPGVWNAPHKSAPVLTPWVKTGEVWHPKRETHRPGEKLYARYVAAINKTISFRVVDLARDLKIFHEWQNKPRVANFWEIAQSESELQAYLERGLSDPHSIPAIVEMDGRSVGYFEFYWVREDRLGPIYDCSDYDRGFHFLIGEDDCLGFKNTDAVLKSTAHFIFLDDIRTQIIAAEPRADNAAVLKYVETFKCWRKVREFDFPHKRAALLEARRDLFFREGYPWH